MTNEEMFKEVFGIDSRIFMGDMCACIANCAGMDCKNCPYDDNHWWDKEYKAYKMNINYKLIIERLQGWLIVQRYNAESELESDTFLNVSKYIKNLIEEEVKYNEEKQSEMESKINSRDCAADNIESKNEETQSGAEEVE